jgi:hypothetical protein
MRSVFHIAVERNTREGPKRSDVSGGSLKCVRKRMLPEQHPSGLHNRTLGHARFKEEYGPLQLLEEPIPQRELELSVLYILQIGSCSYGFEPVVVSGRSIEA